MDAPTGSTIAQENPPKKEWAWGTTDAVPFKPAWGGLKGYDDRLDDMRIDKEWGETQVWQDREERVKRTRSSGMGRKSSVVFRVKSDEELWGTEWGDKTMVDESSSVLVDEEVSTKDKGTSTRRAGLSLRQKSERDRKMVSEKRREEAKPLLLPNPYIIISC